MADQKDRRDIAPSERQQADEKAEAAIRELARAREEAMAEDFTRTFKTQHGKRVLAWLQQRCGHNKIILSANRSTGSVDKDMTTFAAMELNLYLEVRKHLPTELLMEVEYGRIEPSGVIGEPVTGATIERSGRGQRRSRE